MRKGKIIGNLGVLHLLVVGFWTSCCFASDDAAPTTTLTTHSVRWVKVQVLEHPSKATTLDTTKPLQPRAVESPTKTRSDYPTNTATDTAAFASFTAIGVDDRKVGLRENESLADIPSDVLDPRNKNGTLADPDFGDDVDPFDSEDEDEIAFNSGGFDEHDIGKLTPVSTFSNNGKDDIEQLEPTSTAFPGTLVTATSNPIPKSSSVPNRLHYLWLLFVPVLIVGAFLIFAACRRRRRRPLVGKHFDDGSNIHLEEGPGGLGDFGSRPGVASPPPPYSPPPRIVQAPPIGLAPPPRVARGPGNLLRRLSGSTIATVNTFVEPPPQYGSDRARVDTLVEATPRDEDLAGSITTPAYQHNVEMENLGAARPAPFRVHSMPSHVEEEDDTYDDRAQLPVPLRIPRQAPDALPRAHENVPFPIMMPVPMDFGGRR
ncbi:hypothetical protein BJ508DRAFT_154207 [Ascobolus immersus RN42]|uniref:Mid2 domain-containing protein n=1 Tax=Ascobolus immersus RN42 TaxID=1160509 RepID=A0A3N4I1L3_ASCIM|nr:hypothetical protein BJ508DRAFT_154207 [Ascobolus immersus RN42]